MTLYVPITVLCDQRCRYDKPANQQQQKLTTCHIFIILTEFSGKFTDSVKLPISIMLMSAVVC